MADPASLAAFTGTIELVNKTVDLVRNLRQKGDQELTAAEMKHTLIELLGDLVELKSEVVSLKAVLLAKEEEVTQLQTQLIDKQAFKFDGNIYWAEGDDTPYCPRCYEKDNLRMHMVRHEKYYGEYYPRWVCGVCGKASKI